MLDIGTGFASTTNLSFRMAVTICVKCGRTFLYAKSRVSCKLTASLSFYIYYLFEVRPAAPLVADHVHRLA